VNGTDGADASLNFSDSLAVRFFGSGAAVGNADGSIVDCVGNAVPEAADSTTRAVNTFAVVRTADGLQLTCDIGAGPVALVSNIDSFQVLYGLDTIGNDRVPDVWLRASAVGAQWDQVVAVRVALLISSDANTRASQNDTATYQLFDANYDTSNDRGTVFDAATQSTDFRNRLHRTYTTTVFLRNRTAAT
jgi:type IV pilus assembly protein PilW